MANYHRGIAAGVNEYLASQNWSYDFDDETGVFRFRLGIKGRLNKVEYFIRVREGGVTAYGICPITVDHNDDRLLNRVNRFLALANYGLPYGNFELDVTDGEIRFKMSYYCGEDNTPSPDAIELVVDLPSSMMKKYGDGLVAVMLAGSDPDGEIKKIER